MQLKSDLFDSRVALRIFLLLVIASVVPLLTFGWLFARETVAALERHAYDELSAAARGFGHSTLQRLVDALDALPQPMRDAGTAALPAPQLGLAAIAEVRDGIVQTVAGEWPSISGDVQADSESLPTLAVLPTTAGPRDVVIARRSETTTMLGRLEPDVLWRGDALLPGSTEVCVLRDGDAEPIYCSAPLPAAALAALRAGAVSRGSGQLTWATGGDEWLAAYWQLFLPSRFAASPWTVVVSEPRDTALAGIDAVTRVLPRVAILTALLVFALAISQVRRTLTPLRALVAGTQRIAAQDFESPVRIERNDEFGELGTAINDMARQLRHQFDALRALADVDRLILDKAAIGVVVETVLTRLASLVPHAVHVALVLDPNDDEHGTLYRLRSDEPLLLERVSIPRQNQSWLSSGARTITAAALRERQIAFGAWPNDAAVAIAPMRNGSQLVGAFLAVKPADDRFAEREISALHELAARGTVAITADEREAELFRRAHFDALTELPNRDLLDDRLRQAVAQAQREDYRLAVLFVDLDGFKSVNDTLGHRAGDELLKETGLRLTSALRDADTVARLGGDEYALILPRIHGPLEAEAVAIKAIKALGLPFSIDGRNVFVTASIGVALFPEDGNTAEDLLRKADMAMYSAKESGKACYRFFAQEMDRQLQERHALHNDLRNALFAGELFLAYQPQIDFKTQRYRSLEALLRWRHPTRGLVSPALFVPILEETDLINPIGTWVLRRALADLAAAMTQGLPFERVAINVSARQLLDVGFVDTVIDALADAKLEGRHLEIELTEASLVEDFRATNEALSRLAAHGVHIALDDFGTGYSSLAYLNELVFDTLKIDRAFVINLPNAKAAAIVRAIIAVATSLGKEVVAEGIESAQQYQLLDALGCDLGQGYLLAKPMDSAALVEWTHAHAARPPVAAATDDALSRTALHRRLSF